MTKKAPFLGFGLGLRGPHYEDLLRSESNEVDWLEIISETFLLHGGKNQYYLDQFNERYTIVPHGVSLSIGSVDPLDMDYLKQLKALCDRLDAPWFSDHICWTKVHGRQLHNLMPLPYTEATVNFVAAKIRQLQDFMERPFVFENVSSYVEFKQSEMTEWEFVRSVAEKADCGILLDINNIFVSGFNHDFDPMDYIRHIPKDRVYQYHVAGHSDRGAYLFDTHDHDVRDEVWDLFSKTVPLFGEVSVLLERDDHLPPLSDLVKELKQARALHKKAMSSHA